MPKFLFYSQSLGRQIAERLSLRLYIDTNVRSLSVKNMPALVALTSEGFSGTMGREVSSHYVALFKALRPADSGQNEVETFSFKRANEYLTQRLAKHQILDALLAQLTELKMQSSDENAEPQLKSTRADAIIEQSWKDTGMTSLIANMRSVQYDTQDPENTYSLRSTWDSIHYNDSAEKYATTFITECLNGFLSGNGCQATEGNPILMSTISKINSFEYVMGKLDPNAFNLDPEVLLSAFTITGDQRVDAFRSIEKLTGVLTDYELLMAIPNLSQLFKTLVGADQTMDEKNVSNNKQLAMLILETQRVRVLYEVKTFVQMQAWVALCQQSLRPYSSDAVLDFVINAMPTLNTRFNLKELMRWFMNIPVGERVSELFSDIQIPQVIKVGGVSYDAVMLNKATLEGDAALSHILSLFKKLGSYLTVLKGNVVLWEKYNAGSVYFKARPQVFDNSAKDFDNFPIAFVQHGVFAGDKPSTLNHLEWTMLYDWGINAFNSSARALYSYSNKFKNEEDITIFAYGHISYQEYLAKKRLVVMKSESKAEAMSGYILSRLQVPCFPIKRTIRPTDDLFLFLDMALADMGPVSLLPVPPVNPVSILKGADVVAPKIVKKVVVGTYETEMERMPMEFMHVGPLKANVEIKDTILQLRLNISNNVFNRGVKAGDTMLNRFVKGQDAADGIVACSMITRDDLFLEAIDSFFFIPSPALEHKYVIVYSSTNLVDEEGSDMGAFIHTRPTSIKRIFRDPTSSSLLFVPARLTGERLNGRSWNIFSAGADDTFIHAKPRELQ